MAFNNAFGNGIDSSQTVKSFISKFMTEDFFSNIINMSLYPVEVGSRAVAQGNDAIGYIKSFLYDLNKTVDTININNAKQIKSYINTVIVILNIRETGTRIINYDNVFQHIGQQDLAIKNLIQHTINQKITDNEDFRKTVDDLLRSIQVYYEVKGIAGNIIKFEDIVNYASKPEVSVYDLLSKFRNGVLDMYGDLSKLKSHMVNNEEKNYFRIKDRNSTLEFAKALVRYIAEGYSNFKTGYDLFDNNIEGFESGKVHLISAPLT